MHFTETLGGPLAVDFVPQKYRNHRLVRLYFPFADADDASRSWREFVPADAHFPASRSWTELLERAGKDTATFTPARGELDEETAAALRELTDGLHMTCLRWTGYADEPLGVDLVEVAGETYVRSPLTSELLVPGARVPSFAWDASGRLAWGSRLYPDSLVVATDLTHFRQVFNDMRLTATGIRADRDTLPPSAGD